MDILDCGKTLQDQLHTLKTNWSRYDYVFIHYKYTESCGEDGDFLSKVSHLKYWTVASTLWCVWIRWSCSYG